MEGEKEMLKIILGGGAKLCMPSAKKPGSPSVGMKI